MSRFFGFIDASIPFDAIFHTKLLAVTYLGLQLGIFTKTEFAELTRMKVKTTLAIDEQTSVPQGNAEVAKLRAACRNTVHLAAVFLSDPLTQPRQRIIVSCTRAIHKWYGHQSKFLRSCEASREWLCNQANAAWFEPLAATLRVVEDLSVLAYCGIMTKVHASLESLPAHHPRVALQDELAALLAKLVTQLVQKRFARTLWMRSWPAKSCLFYHHDMEVRQRTADELRKDFELFQHTSALRGAFWRKMKARSLFNTVPVQQLVQMLEAADWKCTDEIAQLACQKYSAIMQSKLIEDSFQRERRKEHLGASRPCACFSRAYCQPISHKRAHAHDTHTHTRNSFIRTIVIDHTARSAQ